MGSHGEVEASGRLPEECPYTLEQLLDDEWLPEREAAS